MLFWVIYMPLVGILAACTLTFVMNCLELTLIEFGFFAALLALCWFMAAVPFLSA